MKLLLINPPRIKSSKDPLRVGTPLGLLSLAGQVRRQLPDVEVSLIDAVVEGNEKEKIKGDVFRHGLVGEELKARIKDIQPDVVGIGNIFSAEWINAAYCARIVKEISPETIVVLGGHHPSFESKFMLRNAHADYIVQREAELPFIEFLSALMEGRLLQVRNRIGGLAYLSHGSLVETGRGKIASDLDELSDPLIDLISPANYGPSTNHSGGVINGASALIDLSVSRGCPNACNYCTTSSMWGRRIRAFSPNRIREQVRKIASAGFNHVCIEDDHILLLPKEFRNALFDELRKQKLPWCIDAGIYYPLLNHDFVEAAARSGCYKIAVSFEHPVLETMHSENKYHDLGSQNEVRKKIGKACSLLRKNGISFYAAMMVGFRNETIETLEVVRDYAKYIIEQGAQFATFFYWKPLPGTVDYSLYSHLIPQEDMWHNSPEKWLLVCPIIKPLNISIKEMKEFVDRMSLEVNGHGNTLIDPQWE